MHKGIIYIYIDLSYSHILSWGEAVACDAKFSVACDAFLFVACDAFYVEVHFACAGSCKVRVRFVFGRL